MVPREEFEYFSKESNSMSKTLAVLETLREGISQQQTDQKYDLMRQQHEIHELKRNFDKLNNDMTLTQTSLENKVENEQMNAEIQIVLDQMGNMQENMSQRSSSMAKDVKPIKGQADQVFSKGGMSMAEKTRLNILHDTVNRLMTTQKRVDQHLKQIRMEEVKKRIDSIESKLGMVDEVDSGAQRRVNENLESV